MQLFLDVIPYFQSAKDAVRFIEAAGIPPEVVPKWTKLPVPKLQVGACSQKTKTLQTKNYYAVTMVRAMDLSPQANDEPRHCPEFAVRWLLSIAKSGCKLNACRNAHAPRRVGIPGAYPLAKITSLVYGNRARPEQITCYMDGDKFFVSGSGGWEQITFDRLLAVMSRAVLRVLTKAHASGIARLAITAQNHLYGSDLERECSIARLHYLRDTIGAQLGRLAHLDRTGARAEKIKQMLLNNREHLKEYGALDDLARSP